MCKSSPDGTTSANKTPLTSLGAFRAAWMVSGYDTGR